MSDGHTGMGKDTIRKFYNEEVTDKLQFLEAKCKSCKEITRKQSDLTMKKLKKKKGAGMGELSNEMF